MSRPPHEESFELELEDAFTRMLISRETPSSNNLSPQSEISVNGTRSRNTTTLGLEDAIQPAPTVPPSDVMDDANNLLSSLREGPASKDPGAAIAPLVSLLGRLMDMVPASTAHQLPTAALPDFSTLPAGERRDTPSLYNAKEHAVSAVTEIADFASRAFQLMDSMTQEDMETSLPQPSSIGMSIPSTSAVDPAPAAAENIYFSGLGPTMDKVSDTLGTVSTTKDMSRTMQGSELFLRAAAKKVATSLQSTPDTDPSYRAQQCMFGLVLLHLYELTQDEEIFNGALGATAYSMEALTGGAFPPSATIFVRTWAFSQRLLSRRNHTIAEVETALEIGRKTLDISKACYPSDIGGRRLVSTELAECLLDKYRATGDTRALDEGVDLLQSASPDEEIEDTQNLCILGELLLERFLRLGRLEDIDKALFFAIKMQQFEQEAMETARPSALKPIHPDAARGLHLLAMTWAERFAIVMDIDDLDRAVDSARASLRLCSADHPLYPAYLADLGSLLYQRFVADESPNDIEEAIEKLRAATDHPPSPAGAYVYYPPRAALGLALGRHGAHTGNVHELQEGVRHLARARRDFFGGTHFESRIERDLAAALFMRFARIGEQDDLDEAILHSSSALDRAPSDDRARAELALELGRMLIQRHALKPSTRDFEWAVDTLRSVATSSGPAAIKLEAAMDWTRASAVHGPAATLEALKVALDILPHIAWAGHRVAVQYKTLASLASDIGPWAAACAIACGQLEDAVTYLERGRNVLWAQALKFQPGANKHRASAMETASAPQGANASTASSGAPTELDALSSYLSTTSHGPPTLTEEHRAHVARTNPAFFAVMEKLNAMRDEVTRKLEAHPCHRPENLAWIENFKRDFKGIHQDASRHKAAKRWTYLRESLEDMEVTNAESRGSILKDERLASLLEGGHVVFLNCHPSRCDALVLRRSSAGRVDIGHVPLPDLTPDAARDWAEAIQVGMYGLQEGEMGVRDFDNVILIPALQGLWWTALSPLLVRLSITDPTKPTRIWWCPTGPLAFLPIHAAGPYEGTMPGVPDLVISSYTPTLQSLLRAHAAPTHPFSMLAIGQPETPGLPPLPSVHKELAAIEQACARISHTPTLLVGPAATPLAASLVLSARTHTWLHLSCHASQDARYGFESAFALHGGPLALRALGALDLGRVQLVVLSACLTSAGDARVPDEAVHLAAGVQFAGARAALATLWPVDDRASAFVAERVYAQLIPGGDGGRAEPDARGAAEALHAAVGEMKRARRPMVLWVPFVHYGV